MNVSAQTLQAVDLFEPFRNGSVPWACRTDAGRKSRPHAKGIFGNQHHAAKAKRVIYLFKEGGLPSWICSITNRCSTRCTEKNCPTRCARVSASPACRPIKPVFLGRVRFKFSKRRVAWRSAKSCPTPPRSPMIFVSSDPCTPKPSITILPSPFSDWLTNRWPPLHGFLVELWAGFGTNLPAFCVLITKDKEASRFIPGFGAMGFAFVHQGVLVPGAIRCSTWTIPRASARASVVACSTP